MVLGFDDVAADRRAHAGSMSRGAARRRPSPLVLVPDADGDRAGGYRGVLDVLGRASLDRERDAVP
ncbi:hypothetical protein GCM10025865_09710 [Paraoerskovia sediminicola]|uniref:Uncharacterized protein n=1 Tax=Paraoerskovia sediminicola TaxID=1138587 RepID=A0ABN6XDF1_9CELL|nr:hypothetical protein [Paraoerskovia sediminicola]BDZ41672.1 hypothetical protein GCM10025865_09710 [Paraoerskovia sediminicola]